MRKIIWQCAFAVVISGSSAVGISQTSVGKRQDVLREAHTNSAKDTTQLRKDLVDRASQDMSPATINIPGAGSMPSPSMIDPAAIARQYAQIKAQPIGKKDDETTDVLIFASLSMPKASLERMAADSKRAGSMVIMRGVAKGVGPGKWVHSVAALEPITRQGVAVSLDPDLFERYSIKRVPAVVVATEPKGGCSEDACREYAVVYGDVSLAYALGKLSERTDPIGVIARDKLAKLERQ
jgi:conjugal transfer pilus assembly protein TrbC